MPPSSRKLLPLAVGDVEQVAVHDDAERRLGVVRSRALQDGDRVDPPAVRREREAGHAMRCDAVLDADQRAAHAVQAVDAEGEHIVRAGTGTTSRVARFTRRMPRE